MIRLILAAAALAAAAAAPVLAKGPIEVQICGAAECREIRRAAADAELGRALVQLSQSTAFVPAPELAPYYRVEISAPGDEFYPLHVVPSAGVAERRQTWIRLDARLVTALDGAAGGVRPKSPPRVDRALVNGRPSRSPRVYEGLFAPLGEASVPPADVPHAEIRLETSPPSPWSEGGSTFLYYPTLDTLRRSGDWVGVSPDLAARIEADLVSVRKGESGASLPALAGSAALVVGLGGVAWMTIVRRRGGGRREPAG